MIEAHRITVLILFTGFSIGRFGAHLTLAEDAGNRIQPYPKNSFYWQYKGQPVLLLGGSDDDNLFQWTGARLIEQLDLHKSVGGNYVRNTMSSRDPGNVWPFCQVQGKYDLDRFNDEYWGRLQTFLEETTRRDIIVQIEVWATWDFYGEQWAANPFNPKNNVNYSADQSGLPERLVGELAKPWRHPSDFFHSVPDEKNLTVVLEHQERFVEKLLSHTLEYDHVLYCMDNETAAPPSWARHWASRIRQEAKKASKAVETTEMWDDWNLGDPQYEATFDDSDTFSFLDISQNNHQKGQKHYDNALKRRTSIRNNPRPMTNDKIYGGEYMRFGDSRDGVERFWRNIFGGHAAARFHRPTGGIGLSDRAQQMIQSAREVTDAFDVFSCNPRNDLLSQREANEAYCLAEEAKQYAVYFPAEGSVALDLSQAKTSLSVRWYNVDRGEWQPAETIQGERSAKLTTPSSGQWAVVIVAR